MDKHAEEARRAELSEVASGVVEEVASLLDERFDHVIAELDLRINEIRGIEINRATMPSKDDLVAAAEILSLRAGVGSERMEAIRPRLDRVASWLRGLEVRAQDQGGAVCL